MLTTIEFFFIFKIEAYVRIYIKVEVSSHINCLNIVFTDWTGWKTRNAYILFCFVKRFGVCIPDAIKITINWSTLGYGQTEIFEMLHKQTKTVYEIAYMQANALIVCRSQFNISFEKNELLHQWEVMLFRIDWTYAFISFGCGLIESMLFGLNPSIPSS